MLSAYQNCRLCGHRCGVDRTSGQRGTCGLSDDVLVASVEPHYGEEPELVGFYGSGTIFFAGCNLGCLYCQNWGISWEKRGSATSLEKLAEAMLQLERNGCHNINLVTPTPYTPSILEAARIARDRGLSIPFVYNSGGYESLETLEMCAGMIEIYMPDSKYSDPEIAGRFSGAPDYPEVNRIALQEMRRQVGDLQVQNGIARRGLLIRHLVLPNQIENTFGVLRFIAQELSLESYVNIMDQYHPAYRAEELPGMNCRLTAQEYEAVRHYARRLGLHRGFDV